MLIPDIIAAQYQVLPYYIGSVRSIPNWPDEAGPIIAEMLGGA